MPINERAYEIAMKEPLGRRQFLEVYLEAAKTEQPVGITEDVVRQAATNIEEEMQKVAKAESYFPQEQMRLLQARAALRAVRDMKRESSCQGLLDNWQPIETAPKDGTEVIVFPARNWDSPHGTFAWWSDDDKAWLSMYSGHKQEPTHWMPCIAWPTTLIEGEEA